jgi:DtxR family Mn-dependent transcriptional regulator
MVNQNPQEFLVMLWMAEEDELDELNMPSELEEGIAELVESGFINQAGSLWNLTSLGRLEAAQLIRRQRLGERLRADVLIEDAFLIGQQTCRMENGLLDGIDESVCTLLGHPKFCPHGYLIPQGECCRQMRSTVGRLIAPLTELEPDQSGDVAYLQMNNSGHLQKVTAMGVLPGGKIRLLRRSPSLVFECGYSQFAVDENLASIIHVRINHAK